MQPPTVSDFLARAVSGLTAREQVNASLPLLLAPIIADIARRQIRSGMTLLDARNVWVSVIENTLVDVAENEAHR